MEDESDSETQWESVMLYGYEWFVEWLEWCRRPDIAIATVTSISYLTAVVWGCSLATPEIAKDKVTAK